MNRLTRQLPMFNSLHLSRSAAASVATTKLSLRSKQNSPVVFHRFIRFPHQNRPDSRLYATGATNSHFAKMDHVPPESVHVVDNPGRSGSPVRGSTELKEEVSSRIEIPEELSRAVVLTCQSTAESGSCNVYLVGTSHVSEESCREVEAVIRFLKPEAVFLELCSDRKSLLTRQDLKVPTFREMLEKLKKKHNAFGILYSWFLAKIASKLEVFPGSEFRVASEEAKACGAKVILGDRPVQVTLQRTWRKMPLRHKAKLVYSLAFRAVFVPSPVKLTKMLKEMEDVDMLTLAIREMSKAYPTLMETLVHERDQYMASMLHKAASEHSLVVAVVGRGHLPGIKKHWQQPVSIEELMKIPDRKPVVSILKTITSIGVIAAGVAIVSGIFLSRKK
ncbi:TraB domain-containing protein [Linum grandiflorum]